ncbi:piRNA biogenesis protein EXD1-like [Leptodactylus fuscus]|uniref:piRNA biogenesis protein EXD1-like n=1 Tax=Leptodactylus fuscus TaxID=238119 RepID=UPI003F4E951A
MQQKLALPIKYGRALSSCEELSKHEICAYEVSIFWGIPCCVQKHGSRHKRYWEGIHILYLCLRPSKSPHQASQMDSRSLSRLLGKRVTVTLTYGRHQGTLIQFDRGHAIMLCKDHRTHLDWRTVLWSDESKCKILYVNLILGVLRIQELQQSCVVLPEASVFPAAEYGGYMRLAVFGQVPLLYVKDLTTNTTMTGVHLYFAPEILNVELQIDTDRKKCLEMESKGKSTTRERAKAAPFQMAKEVQDVKRRARCHPDMQAIKTAVHKLEVNFTVIDQFRTKFGNAIGDIQRQPVIGLAYAGSNVCRDGSLYSLQVATRSHVYLFDIAILGPDVFKQGLKAVLESESVGKVVHDCRRLSDCLFNQYGIVLNNVFDTQVADIFLFYMTTGGFLPQCTNSLEDCLTKYLDMESSKISFLPKTKEIIKDNLFWSLHPLPSFLQKALVLEASYILSLHMTMTNAMMADFTSIVAGYLRVYADSDFTSSLQVPGATLPCQFIQFRDLQRKRQEKAVKDYVVDESGLLAKPGKNQSVSGKGQKASDKTQMSQDLPSSTLDIKRDQSETGINPVNVVKSEGHNMGLHVAPNETRGISQSVQERLVWSAAQSSGHLQFPGQALSPFFSLSPTTRVDLRIVGAQLLAKTTYAWRN